MAHSNDELATKADYTNDKIGFQSATSIPAAELLREEARAIDPEVSRRVLRKIDTFLMPAMVLGYGLVYYDKAILGSAALFGMTTDLHLFVVDTSTTPPTTNTSRLSWATSIFYFGQLAGSYPMTYLLQRFSSRFVLGPAVMLWAVICASTAGVQDYHGLYVQRFFLGFTESIVPTAFMITVSGYYTQSEQALRQTWWFSGTGWFTIIGGGLNHGFSQIKGGALTPWQYIYVFAGALTFLFGIWCFFLPSSALHAWFLTPEERVVAVERLRAGQTGVPNDKIKWAQIKEAVLDVKIWLVALTMASGLLRYADTGAHENLHSNLPPEIMCFSNEPIPNVLSERALANFGSDAPFRHREIMQQWVQDVFKRGQHEHLIEFDTSVERVEKIGHEWTLTLRKCSAESTANSWWQESFDAVVVATGHYNIPAIPRIPGLAEYDGKFPGRIQHSKHYQNAAQYQDKRVIVVGGSVSAFDALHDIRQVCKLPIISSLRRPSQVFGTAPFTHPYILVRSPIQAFDADTGRITFFDGTHVEEVDVVLFATGYDFSFPFLSGIKPKNGRVPGLYQHVFHAAHPTLAFIGMVTGSFGLRIFEWQAVAVARVLAGRSKLPAPSEMEAWELARIEERGDGPAFWALMPDFERYFEDLSRLAGDPEPGTTGRVLPKYDSAWGDAFWAFVDWRIERWKGDCSAEQVGGS